MEQAAKRSHHAEKVSSGVPQRAPRAMCSARDALLLAVVLVHVSLWVRVGGMRRNDAERLAAFKWQ